MTRTIDDHVRQWKHNRDCAASIDAKYRDWQVTAMFYAALHSINAAACKLGATCSDHETRNELVRKNAAFAGLRKPYLRLYRVALTTRYDPDPDAWIPGEYIDAQAIANALLLPVERHVQTILDRQLSLRPLVIKC